MGMVNSPIATTAVSGMPRDQTGVAAAVASTGRQFGSALGVALAGAFATGSGGQLAASTHPAWGVLAGCGGVVLVVGLISTGRWARSTTQNINRDGPSAGDGAAIAAVDRRPAHA